MNRQIPSVAWGSDPQRIAGKKHGGNGFRCPFRAVLVGKSAKPLPPPKQRPAWKRPE
jgi:hypothetical protein